MADPDRPSAAEPPAAVFDGRFARALIAAEYDYTDELGRRLFQVVRLQPKGFRVRRQDASGTWVPNLAGTRCVLYRLPRVLEAACVIVVEGEKDVESLESLPLPQGWAATTSPFGAGRWRPEYGAALAGKSVWICPDKDEPGAEHLRQVGRALSGLARELRVVTVPGVCKDVGDWIADGATAEMLMAALAAAPPFADPQDHARAFHREQEPVDSGAEITHVYDYTDTDGRLLFQVARLRPKSFRTRWVDGAGGWHLGIAGTTPALYRQPRVAAADTVLVVEGEKDVETAERLGLPAGWAATCSPFGVCQWLPAYSRLVAGKAVYLCPDTDAAGQEHLLHVGLALAGLARELRVVVVPPPCKDLSEWVEHGGSATAFAALLRDAAPFDYPRDDGGQMRGLQPLAAALDIVGGLASAVVPAAQDAPDAEFSAAALADVMPGWLARGPGGGSVVCIRGFEALAVAALQALACDAGDTQARAHALSARLELRERGTT